LGVAPVGVIILTLGVTVRIADQKLIQQWWVDYAGDEKPTNTLLREFYIAVIRPSDLYYYGIVFEVFDLLTNGIWEPREVYPQRERGLPAAGAGARQHEVAA